MRQLRNGVMISFPTVLNLAPTRLSSPSGCFLNASRNVTAEKIKPSLTLMVEMPTLSNLWHTTTTTSKLGHSSKPSGIKKTSKAYTDSGNGHPRKDGTTIIDDLLSLTYL
jgi:hypothetical protein